MTARRRRLGQVSGVGCPPAENTAPAHHRPVILGRASLHLGTLGRRRASILRGGDRVVRSDRDASHFACRPPDPRSLDRRCARCDEKPLAGRGPRSEPRVDRFALEGEDAEDAFVHPVERLAGYEAFQSLDTEGELA